MVSAKLIIMLYSRLFRWYLTVTALPAAGMPLQPVAARGSGLSALPPAKLTPLPRKTSVHFVRFAIRHIISPASSLRIITQHAYFPAKKSVHQNCQKRKLGNFDTHPSWPCSYRINCTGQSEPRVSSVLPLRGLSVQG